MPEYPFRIHFYRKFPESACIENNYIIFYMIRGEGKITVSDKEYLLKDENFLIVNCNHRYFIRLGKEALLMKTDIDRRTLCGLSGSKNLLFRCYDYGQQSTKYEKFRYRLNELLGEFTVEPSGLNHRKMSRLYNICDYIVRAFVVSGVSGTAAGPTGKGEKILEYIEKNYRNKVSLEDAAGYMYMAPASFSRFFSRTMGITFVRYLTKVRLEHAAEDLLSTDLPVSDIVYKNGFGSISQFNKQFKEFYNMAPHEYKSRAGMEETDGVEETDSNLVRDLEKYQNKTRLVVVKEQKIRIQEQEIDMLQGREFHNPFGNLLHFGFASRLLSAAYQKQILYLKQNLDFEYGAFNGIFSPEFDLKMTQDQDELNFVKLDYVLDFLTENNIKPLIVLDNQVFSMVKDLNDRDRILCREVFTNEEQCLKVIRNLMDHIIYRYGIREVSSWKFEIWYDAFERTILGLTIDFNTIWDKLYRAISNKIPGIEIGGCSLGSSGNLEISKKFYSQWTQAECPPDFLSMNVFPYHTSEEASKMTAIRLNVEESFSHYMLNFKSILAETGFQQIPLIVLEWNLSFVQRNYFNDMAGKAAIMVSQMIQNINETEEAGYWPASDLYAGDFDASRILNGACGLISSDGICKPAFYALQFVKELQNMIVSRGEHYIVTKDGKGYFSILLFNDKKLNYNYYSRPEASVGIQDSVSIFSDEDALEFRLTLRGVPEKTYFVRKRIIGPEHGSVLDEWMELGTEVPSSVTDMDYLKTRSVPLRKNNAVTAAGGILTVMENLKAHEIMLLQFV